MALKQDLWQRFINKVIFRADSECWGWKASKFSDGYGSIAINSIRNGEHRISYELFYGTKIPVGLLVLHKCDNPECTNPDHLFLGNPADNSRDMVLKGRSFKPEQKGELNKNSRLTEKLVRKIRKRYLNGESVKLITNSLNEHYMTIWQVCKNKTWKHI